MKKILLVLFTVLLVAGCQNKTSDIKVSNLGDMTDGIIYYYSGKDKVSVKKLDAIKEVSKKYNVDVIPVNVDTETGQKLIGEYKSSHRQIVDNYTKIVGLEEKLYKDVTDEAQLSTLGMEYKYALNLVKEPTLTDAQDTNLREHKANILNLSIIQDDELDELLGLQTEPRIKIPYYSEAEAPAYPVMKIIYDSNVRKTVSLSDPSIPSNKSELVQFLENDGWIGNFKHSDDANLLQQKLENNETFIAFFYGNSCPHCKKFEPVLNEQAKAAGVTIVPVDMFLDVNAQVVGNIINEGKHGLTEIKWVPTLMAFKDGQAVDAKGAFDWAINNPKAELGYDIDEVIVKDFLETYGK